HLPFVHQWHVDTADRQNFALLRPHLKDNHLNLGHGVCQGTGSSALIRHRGWARTLMASAAIACALALAGCETDGLSPAVSAKAMAPLSGEMMALLDQKSMPKDSPMLVRIFKEEAELEVWKQDTT